MHHIKGTTLSPERLWPRTSGEAIWNYMGPLSTPGTGDRLVPHFFCVIQRGVWQDERLTVTPVLGLPVPWVAEKGLAELAWEEAGGCHSSFTRIFYFILNGLGET